MRNAGKGNNYRSNFLLAAIQSLFGFEQGEIHLLKPFHGPRGQARARGKKKRKAKLHLIRMVEIKAKREQQDKKNNRWFKKAYVQARLKMA